MKKKSLNLHDLKVKSFTTAKKEETTGGRWSVGGLDACPHTGEGTLDYLGCNSLDMFYCQTQGIEYDTWG